MNKKSFKNSYAEMYLINPDIYHKILDKIESKSEKEELINLNPNTDDASYSNMNLNNDDILNDGIKVEERHNNIQYNTILDKVEDLKNSLINEKQRITGFKTDASTQTDNVIKTDTSMQTDNGSKADVSMQTDNTQMKNVGLQSDILPKNDNSTQTLNVLKKDAGEQTENTMKKHDIATQSQKIDSKDADTYTEKTFIRNRSSQTPIKKTDNAIKNDASHSGPVITQPNASHLVMQQTALGNLEQRHNKKKLL